MTIEFRINPNYKEYIWIKNGEEHRDPSVGPSSWYLMSGNVYWYVDGGCVRKELKSPGLNKI